MHAALLARRAGTLTAPRRIAHPARALASKASARPPTSASPPPPAPSSSTEPAAPAEDASTASTATPVPTPPSNLKGLDFTSTLGSEGEQPGRAEQQRTGARSSKDSLSSIEKKRKNLGRITLGVMALALGVGAVNLGNEWDAEELKAKKMTIEEAPSTRWGRMQSRFNDVFNIFSEPQWPELLPPPLPAAHQKPLTLVLSIDDLLVTSTWDREHGWRTAKRPGVDYFLAYLSQFYEIVIWTTQHHYTATPIIEKLDPYRFFTMYHLFRESCKSVNGEPVKDLSYLNRDLSKVIVLDTHAEHIRTHPGSAIIIPKWTGQPRDKGLIAMIPFLESIGIYKPEDVRPILAAYSGKDVPLEYAKNEAIAKQAHIEEWNLARQTAKGKGLAGGGFTLSALFGSAPAGASPVPPTYLEQKRAEAQAQYREEQAYIAANKEQFEKLLEEDRDAAMREGAGSLLGALEALTGGPKPASPDAPASAPAASTGAEVAPTST